MVSRLRRILVLLGSLALAGAVEAQFREDLEVRLVEIDVVVTDRDGRHVHGLKPEDFVVLDGAVPKKISNFTEYGSAPSVSAGHDGNSIAAGAGTAPSRPQNLLILLDPLPRSFFIRASTFARLEALLDRLMRDGDRVSIVAWSSTLERAQSILASTDRESVRNALLALARIETTGGRAKSADDFAESEAMFLDRISGDVDIEALQRSNDYFRGVAASMALKHRINEMKRLVRTLSAAPGKKVVLYVSNGSFGIPSPTPAVTLSKAPPTPAWDHLAGLAAVNDLVRTANAGGVTFYAVAPSVHDDPKAITSRVDEMVGLRELTLPTGGLYGFGVGSVETIGTALADDVSAHYSIAYQSAGNGNDREHKIRVTTRNPEYRVRAKESFIDKSSETEARDALLAGFFGGRLPNDVDFSVAFAGAPRRGLQTIDVRIPSTQLDFAQDGPDQVAHVRVIITASNGTDPAPIKESDLRIVVGRDDGGGFVRYSFQMAVASGDLTIGVLDRHNGHLGAETIRNH